MQTLNITDFVKLLNLRTKNLGNCVEREILNTDIDDDLRILRVEEVLEAANISAQQLSIGDITDVDVMLINNSIL